MNLPHEQNVDNQLIKEPNAIISAILNFRSSNAVIKLAHAINITLTFLFGYRNMAEVFFLFGEATPEALIFAGALAGFALIGLFDLPYHAWTNISERPGLSTEQIATAENAATWSLRGSLAASAAAIVLSQTLIDLPQTIVYGATFIGLVAVAWIAIKHMQWWDDFKKEGFDAKRRSETASQEARRLNDEINREKQLANLKAQEDAARHELLMQQLTEQQQLELETLAAEMTLRKQALQQKLAHKREVHKQAAAKLTRKIGEVSDRAAEVQAEELLREFAAENGIAYTPNGSTNGVKTDPKSN